MKLFFAVLAIILAAVIATPVQATEFSLQVMKPVSVTIFTGDLVGNVYSVNGSKISTLYTFEVKSAEILVAVRRIAHRVRADGRIELTVLTDDERWVALVLNHARTKAVEIRGPFEARGEEALLVTKKSVQTGGDEYMQLVGYDPKSGVVQSETSLESTISMTRIGRDIFAIQRGAGLVVLPEGNAEQAQPFGRTYGTVMALAKSGRTLFVLSGSYGDTPGRIEALNATTGETKWSLKSVMAGKLGIPYGRVLGFVADDAAVYVLSYEGETTQVIAIPYVKNDEGESYFEYPVVVAESSAPLCGLDVAR